MLAQAHVLALQGSSVLCSTMTDEEGHFTLRVPEAGLVDVVVLPTTPDEGSMSGRTPIRDQSLAGRVHQVAPGTRDLVIRTAWTPRSR